MNEARQQGAALAPADEALLLRLTGRKDIADALQWIGERRGIGAATVHELLGALVAAVEAQLPGSQAALRAASRRTLSSGVDTSADLLQTDTILPPGAYDAALAALAACTPTGTRAVALRQLRMDYIKVLVLPSDAGEKEIVDLELQLQMETEVKQDYTLTSQLLFIEDLINRGSNTLEVGRALRPDFTSSRSDKKKATDLVEQELRLLGLIRDVITASGGSLTFVYFDDKRQSLLEIDQDYQKIKNTNPVEAIRIRDAKLAFLIAGIDYRKLREVDSNLLDKYLAPAIREDSTLAPHADSLLGAASAVTDDPTPAGLDVLGDEPQLDAGSSASLSMLYTLLAKSGNSDTVELPGGNGSAAVAIPRQALVASLYGTITTAIENKQLDSRKIDDMSAPMVHLHEAVRSLDKASSAYASVGDRAGFDTVTFHAVYAEYERAAAQLAELLGDGSRG